MASGLLIPPLFSCLAAQECKTLVDGEAGVALPTALKNHFVTLEVLSKWNQKVCSARHGVRGCARQGEPVA